MIPIIDMKTFQQFTILKKYKSQFWDYYFEKINNYKLDDVYRSKNVYFTGPKFIIVMYLDAIKMK